MVAQLTSTARLKSPRYKSSYSLNPRYRNGSPWWTNEVPSTPTKSQSCGVLRTTTWARSRTSKCSSRAATASDSIPSASVVVSRLARAVQVPSPAATRSISTSSKSFSNP